MTVIDLVTDIDAPIEHVFDLARDLELHARSMSHTGERAIDGRITGLAEAGDTVTWRARHFGVWWSLTSRITVVDAPVRFEDVQEDGPFAWFRHEHGFERAGDATRMRDHWEHRSPLGPLGRLVDSLVLGRYMRSQLMTRNAALKIEAEGHARVGGAPRPGRAASSGRMSAVGLALWLAALALLPAPLAGRIFLLAPFVIVPRLVVYLPPRSWIGTLGGWPLLVAALPLLVAFALPAGPLAGAFAVPWLVCATIGLLGGVRHGLTSLPSILAPRRLPDLGVDVALGFWAVGATFAALDRLAVDTGFPPVIILLTATHFHFAGFGLLAMACLIATTRRWMSVSVAGLIVGIPLTALGFVLWSDPINAAGAALTGASGIGVGLTLLTSRIATRSDWFLRVAGIALLVGMPMGIGWSVSILLGQSFLDLETMVRTHGVLNALAVLLAVLAYRPSG